MTKPSPTPTVRMTQASLDMLAARLERTQPIVYERATTVMPQLKRASHPNQVALTPSAPMPEFGLWAMLPDGTDPGDGASAVEAPLVSTYEIELHPVELSTKMPQLRKPKLPPLPPERATTQFLRMRPSVLPQGTPALGVETIPVPTVRDVAELQALAAAAQAATNAAAASEQQALVRAPRRARMMMPAMRRPVAPLRRLRAAGVRAITWLADMLARPSVALRRLVRD